MIGQTAMESLLSKLPTSLYAARAAADVEQLAREPDRIAGTLPVCVFLGAALFAGLLNIMGLLGLS